MDKLNLRDTKWELSEVDLKPEFTKREKAALINWKIPMGEIMPEINEWSLPDRKELTDR